MATTIKKLVERELKQTGESSEELECYYREHESWRMGGASKPIVHCGFADLPESEYDNGYGGTNGPAFIAFTDKYVYISVQYDGSESIEAIPRHPEFIGDSIPWPVDR